LPEPSNRTSWSAALKTLPRLVTEELSINPLGTVPAFKLDALRYRLSTLAVFRSANVMVESMIWVVPIVFAATFVATMPVRSEPSTAGSWVEAFSLTSWLAPLKVLPCLVTDELSMAALFTLPAAPTVMVSLTLVSGN
jgi:hypothetical protein